jgi:hypothetical protein
LSNKDDDSDNEQMSSYDSDNGSDEIVNEFLLPSKIKFNFPIQKSNIVVSPKKTAPKKLTKKVIAEAKKVE